MQRVNVVVLELVSLLRSEAFVRFWSIKFRCCTEYPPGCSTYHGPFSVECLTSMWHNATCIAEGTKFPPKLNSTEIDAFTGMGLEFVLVLRVVFGY